MKSPSVGRSGKPRVRRAPRSGANDVDDAVFLASSYGLKPDDWQEDVLESWLGRRRDGRWSAETCGLACPRQNGKNGTIEVRELFGMVMLGEKFLHTAHEVKTARKAFLRIASFFENPRQYPELAALAKEVRRTNGQEAIVLHNGGSVEFIARSRGSGRGFTVDILVLDEAQELTTEELAALLPTISAAPSGNPQVIITGTPPDPEQGGERGEVFTALRNDGEANRNPRLAWTDFGVADGPLPDIENRDTWFEVNPALGIRLAVEEVDRELALMRAKPESFARERLGWWGDPNAAAGTAFGPGQWETRAVPGVEPVVQAIGLAVSLDRQYASVGVAGMGKFEAGDDLAIVGAGERKAGLGWLVAEAKRLQGKYDCDVVIDSRGPGADLAIALEAAEVRFTEMTVQDVCDACALIFDHVQQGRLVHPDHGDLNAAVAGAAKKDVGDRWAWGRKLSTSDVSMLEAVTLALWSVVTNPDYDLDQSAW
jgi:hypothetical protein